MQWLSAHAGAITVALAASIMIAGLAALVARKVAEHLRAAEARADAVHKTQLEHMARIADSVAGALEELRAVAASPQVKAAIAAAAAPGAKPLDVVAAAVQAPQSTLNPGATVVESATTGVTATQAPSSLRVILPLLLALIGASLLPACGLNTYAQGRVTLDGVEKAVQSSTRALAAYDTPHQAEVRAAVAIKCAATSPPVPTCTEQALAALDTYYSQRDAAIKALATLDGALGVASAGIALVEAQGKAFDPSSLPSTIGPLVDGVVAALQPFGFVPPGLAALLGGAP